MSVGGAASFGVLGEISNQTEITTYDGWRAPIRGTSSTPTWIVLRTPSVFPAQTFNGFGNATRFNPKMRIRRATMRNINLARTFSLKEKAHLEFRAEAFNLFNRVVFGPLGGGNTIANANFGKWQSQANAAPMQVVAKITW